ncbi:MAG TPA: hypothetical protein VGM03_11480 [Phycisphaerae bacterium]
MTLPRRARQVRKWLIVGLCATCFQAAGTGCPVDTRSLASGLILSIGSVFISSYVNDALNVPPSVRL